MTRHLNVFLDGVRAGGLTQSSSGTVTFDYDEGYRATSEATPLSLSMPLGRPRHTNRVVTAWLEGLLPDNLSVREEWARRFEVSARNAFSLLRHVGRDAAGAVQVLPTDVDPPDAARRVGQVQRLSGDEVTAMVKALAARAAGWEVGERAGRWSLAGAQSKVALHRLGDGTWAVPLDSTPTTHILKPTPVDTRFTTLHVNEFVCLDAARRLGLPAAKVELVDFDGAATLVATRYDRLRREGRWHRLHQEDLLQALSYRPEQKYQSDGGPSVKNVASLFTTLALPDRDLVQAAFFDAFAYNVLVGGTDAHAKNYSLLLRGRRVALAPLYDVASYAPYLQRGEAVRSSMKVGKHWEVRDVTVQDWVDVAAALALGKDEALGRVERLRQGLPGALQAAAAGIPGHFRQDADRIADTVSRQRHLTSAGLSQAVRYPKS